jgi:CubicO group peptidase (beta-lactamase class C family)
VRIQIDAQLLRALDHVRRFTPRAKALSFIFLRTPATSTSAIALLGLTSAQAVRKPRQLVAGKQALVQMRHARHAGVLRVAEDRRAQLDRPAQPLQFAHADEGMLFQRGVALVVEVVQQRRGRVELDQAGARPSPDNPSRSASASPQAATQASTASACLRRLSLWVHSVSSCQAAAA